MSRGRRKRGSKSKKASAVLKTGFETPILNEPAEFMTMKELSMKKKSNNYNHEGFIDGSTVGSTPHPTDSPYTNEAIKQLDAAAIKQMDLAAKKAEEAWSTRVTASAPSYGYPDDTDSLEPSYTGTVRSFSLPRKNRAPVITKDVQATYTPIMGEPYAGKGFGEVSKSSTPADAEDFATLKETMQVNRVNEQTHIFAIATNKENAEENQISAIRCYGGIPFGGYVHDATRDSYLISCVSFLQVGSLPFSFMLAMPNIGEWKVKVPIPVPIIEKAISPSQRAALEEWQKKYPTPKYEIYFLQMLGCH